MCADGLISPIFLPCFPFFCLVLWLLFCYMSFLLPDFLLSPLPPLPPLPSPQRSSPGDFTWYSARGRRRCLLLLPQSTLCQNPGRRLGILHRAYVADLFFPTLSSLHPCLLSARLRACRFFRIVRKEWWIFVFFCVRGWGGGGAPAKDD